MFIFVIEHFRNRSNKPFVSRQTGTSLLRTQSIAERVAQLILRVVSSRLLLKYASGIQENLRNRFLLGWSLDVVSQLNLRVTW